MKRLILLANLLALAIDIQAAPNLLSNPGFEEVENALPIGWAPFQDGREDARFLVQSDSTVYRSGHWSLKIGNLEEDSRAGAYTTVPLRPGDHVFSVHIRTMEGTALLVGVSVGDRIVKWAVGSIWQVHSIRFTVEEPEVRIALSLESGKAPIWVDDVELVRVPVSEEARIFNEELNAWDSIRFQLPVAYEDHPDQFFPLLVVTHGLGGDRHWAFGNIYGPGANEGYPELANSKDWILVSGDLGSTSHWSNDQALSHQVNLIQYMLDHYRADPDRIYIHGASMGGGTSLLTCQNLANRKIKVDGEVRDFIPAACAATYGWTNLFGIWSDEGALGNFKDTIEQAYGASPTDDPWIYRTHSPIEFAENLRNVPVYMEHEIHDTVVPPYHLETMRDSLWAADVSTEIHLRDQDLAEGHNNLAHHPSEVIAFFDGKVAQTDPKVWSFTTYLAQWERFGYTVTTTLDRQLVSLREVSVHGMTVESPNSVTITTAPKYAPSQQYILLVTSAAGDQTEHTAAATMEGRLTFSLPARGCCVAITSETSVQMRPGTELVADLGLWVYPNPFNVRTAIAFDLPVPGHVRLSIYNMAGQRVEVLVDENLNAGPYRVPWDGNDDAGAEMASGIYIYELHAGAWRRFGNMLLLR